MKTHYSYLLLVGLSVSLMQAQTPSGELQTWHKTTLSFDGPQTSESATPNPFTDYRLTVTFTHAADARSYVVPGFYAGCIDAAESGCESGATWKVHFAPDRPGSWNWQAEFTTGTDVAINSGGSSAGFMDGATGSFEVAPSNKSGRDFRAPSKGRLHYIGEHYLKHSGTAPDNPSGPWFVKAGADSPENALAYDDFDATPNRGNRRKSWTPHQQDYVSSEAFNYTWQGGKGSELLGVVNYLSQKGVNAMSFLTFSLHGDDENVFPHLLKVDLNTYNGYGDSQQWANGIHHDRFDLSKMAQWEEIFSYADQKGVFLHFKTMETENDNLMDDNTLGRERKVYYRELIARFGHHLALNWNITEESTIPDEVTREIAAYIAETDPYDHHIVLHTYPGQQDERYDPLLGDQSELTGPSIQTGKNNVHRDVVRWVQKSANAGKKWVVANDEQGSANIGVDADPTDNKLVRHQVLWGALMGGGMGVEYYYGYQTGETDLTAQDHRSRDQKYTEAALALNFFNTYLQNDLPDMISMDDLTADGEDYAFAKANKVYTVYRPNGGSTAINLPNGAWEVQWYNPRTGGALSSAESISTTLVAPSTEDWVALITGTAGGNTCEETLEPVADAYLEGGVLMDNEVLRVEAGTRVSYLQYDLTAITDPVSTAQLQLQVSGDPGSGVIQVYKGSATGWTEANLNSTNAPTAEALLGSLVGDFLEGQIYTWNLTGVTSGELFNIILIQDSGNDVSFSSRTGVQAPRLQLELDCGTLDVDELTWDQSLKLYPNPVQDRAVLKGERISSWAIYTMQGQQISSAKQVVDASQHSLDLSPLASGVYVLVVDGNRAIRFLKR
ncbi:DUF5060 domain-containing protein [Croceiramulus getboli]|nr:DUF5060 domain-containing protein [Flavobacteriaceae bacterium YJPT1-3]